MQMLLNSRWSEWYKTSLTHGINIWFKTRLLGTICKQSAHLDLRINA